MTNPNSAVGTNAAYDGRTSVNAFNDDLTIYSRGILSGWECSPSSDMTVELGGNGTDRDAAVAEDNAGNKTSINNISGSPIEVTIPAAPSTNSRIDLIVAYADNPPSGTSTVADNPAACGIIVVSGTAASSPTAPTDDTIRDAITSDGATGSTAYYVILAEILVGTSVTTIGSGVITQGDTVTSYALPATDTVTTDAIADEAVTSDKIDWTSFNDPSSNYLELGDVKIQWGTKTVTMNGTSAGSYGVSTVTLPTAFDSSSTYAVVATPSDPSSTNALKATAQSLTTTTFQITVGTAAAAGTATVYVKWIAIGV